jgi:hypothetical protein
MSRQNKVNPDHYTIAGRLSPDDLARERWKQNDSPTSARGRRARKAMPPWMAEEASGKRTPVAGAANENQEEERKEQRQEEETFQPAGVKESGTRGTPRTRKAPRARGSATRAVSPQCAGRPGAHKTASRGTQNATAKKGTRRSATPAKASTRRSGTMKNAAKPRAAKRAATKGTAKKKR